MYGPSSSFHNSATRHALLISAHYHVSVRKTSPPDFLPACWTQNACLRCQLPSVPLRLFIPRRHFLRTQGLFLSFICCILRATLRTTIYGYRERLQDAALSHSHIDLHHGKSERV